MRFNELYDDWEPKWRGVTDCYCNISELATPDAVVGKSAMYEWLVQRERETAAAEPPYPLEQILDISDRIDALSDSDPLFDHTARMKEFDIAEEALLQDPNLDLDAWMKDLTRERAAIRSQAEGVMVA